jgi:tetratricopeptide (TPR) repeat protein
MPLTRKSTIAIVAPSRADADMIIQGLRSLGFPNHRILVGTHEAYEVCVREQFSLFIDYNGCEPMTGLSFIQKLRATGNYGAEAHLLLVDQLEDALLPVLAEFNIKYVVPKPFLADRVIQKFDRMFREECNLPPAEQDYRAVLSAHYAGMRDMAWEMGVKALKTHGQSEKLLLLLGDIQGAGGHPEEARKFYGAALKVNPLSAAAMHKTAQTYMMENNFQRAAELLNEQMKVNPLNLQLLANAGLSNYETGDYQLAEQVMGQLKQMDQTNKVAMETLAKVAVQEGRVRDACDLLGSTHTELELIQFFNNAGVRLSQQNNIPAAIDMYKKCLEVMGKSEHAHAILYNLGIAHAKLKDFPNAMLCYKKALERKPDFAKAQQALARLEEQSAA